MKTTYKIDPAHSSAHFSIRHMMISNVRGSFGNITGTIEFDSDQPANSSVDAVIDANTISTQDAKRDEHLKSPDFLHVEQHPRIEFKSTKVAAAGKDEWKVTGNLTIHGVSKEVVLDVEGPTAEGKDPYGNARVGASAKTKIKRSDFGVKFNVPLEAGGFVIGDDVKIELDISAIRS